LSKLGHYIATCFETDELFIDGFAVIRDDGGFPLMLVMVSDPVSLTYVTGDGF
jgi:hypothetical protein